MNNGKKEFPMSGLEQDVIYARKRYCFTKNNPKIVKFAKRSLNKRLRSFNKNILA